jgi:DNA-binding NarL/FixJ family response regulator
MADGLEPDRLIGRAAELQTLERVLAWLSTRRQRCLVIDGEPGIGKSALLGRLAQMGRLQRCQLLSGAGADFERDVPFGLVIDAIDDRLRELDDSQLRRLCGPELAAAAVVLPSLGHLAVAEPTRLQEERYRLHRAVRRLICGLAAWAPTLLVIDDVHWADRETVECLSHLIRHPVAARLLIAMATRAGQCPRLLASALATGEQDGDVVRLSLGPLSRDAVDRLAGRGLDRRAREQLYGDSGGNPFYATALAGAYRQGARGGRGQPAMPADGSVPASVLAAVEAELSALSSLARPVLQTAAVHGEPFEPHGIARLSAVPEPEVERALDEAAAAGVIHADPANGQLCFRHPIVRRAAYDSAPPAWRRGLHARAAGALRAQGAAPAAWAHHLARSATPGDHDAVDSLVRAAQSVATSAPASAAQWLGVALDLLSDADPPARRLGVLLPLATALVATGELEAGRDALDRTLGLLDAGSASSRARALAALAMVEHMLGRHDSATALLAGALDGLAVTDTPAAAELGLQLAWDHLYRSEYPEAVARARVARRLATSLADRPLAAATAGVHALGEFNAGQLSRAEAAFTEGSARLSELADHDLADRLDAFVLLGFGAYFLDRLDVGVAMLERGIAISRATGRGQLYVPMLLLLSLVDVARGELAAAGELADDAEDVARLSGNAQWLSWSLTVKGTVAGLIGDPARALRFGEAAVVASGDVTQHYFSMVARCYLAEARLEAGDPDGCVHDLIALCGTPTHRTGGRPFRPVPYETLTRAELARGRIDAAAGWAQSAALTVERIGVPGRRGEALRAQAEVALARGEARAAVELAEAAVAAVAAAGRALDLARGHLLAGAAMAAVPDPDGAVTHLLRAREGFAACGAARLDDAAAQRLRRLGHAVPRGGRPPGTAPGTALLSRRERQIAELISSGKTNREIAAELFLSVKTVEGHLAKVFGKLGVSRRAAVAAAVGAERL